MPLYAQVCPKGHSFEHLRPAAEAKVRPPCPECGAPSRQDYAAKKITAHVDGEHSGYYAPETGFPVDPKNPAKRICPARIKAKDTFSRLADTSKNAMVYE